MISPTELGLLVCGIQDLDVDDWKDHSICLKNTPSEVWNCFWDVVTDMSQEQRSELLEFVTGSSTLPVGGFAALPGGPGLLQLFSVGLLVHAARMRPACGDGEGLQNRLPTAATCFNTIYLPACTDTEKMQAALLEALANRGAGFNEGVTVQ